MLKGFGSDDLRIIAIDPGTNSCGFSVLSINLETQKISVLTSYTVKGNQFITQNKMYAELHGDKYAKLKGYQEHLEKLCEKTDPYMVTSEAPYMGRFAAAFGALKEQCMVLRLAAASYDFTMPFMFIEPTPVKKFMGAKGSDKTLMTKGLKKRTDVDMSGIKVDDLDEHAIDSICVGLYWMEKIKEALD